MNTLKILYNSIFSPLKVINRKEAEGKLLASFIIVLITALFGSVIAPTMYYLTFKHRYDLTFSPSTNLFMFCVSILTWLAVCTVFWLISIFLKKEVSFKQIVSTWGLSYTPNLLCIAAYNALLLKSNAFIGSSIAAFIINTFFIMVLIWKVIYYFMEMKYVMKATAFELFIITIITGIAFLALMAIGGVVGIQVPML